MEVMNCKSNDGLREEGHGLSVDDLLAKVEAKHDEAYLYINQALSCDEWNEPDRAIDLYIRGIESMNAAYAIWTRLSEAERSRTRDNRLASKIDRMTMTLVKAQSRVEELLGSRAGENKMASSVAHDDQPPSYVDAMATADVPSPSYADATAPPRPSVANANAAILFYVDAGVQIFFIAPDDNVSAPSYPSALSVYQFLDEPSCGGGSSPPAFMQVGEWIYPLMPNISPALHANWGAYIFPDVTARETGCYVGVIIPDTVTAAEREHLEDILRSFTNFRKQLPRSVSEEIVAPSASRSDAAKTISRGIDTASDWISWGVTKGAQVTGKLVRMGSEKLCERLQPNAQCSKIDSRVQKGAHYARVATVGAVKVSGYLVDKVGEATSALARTVAPHIRRHSETLLPESWTQKDGPNGRSTVDKVAEVAVSGLKGFSTVYLGLENSAKILAKSIADETVHVVQHKFGADAGRLTENVVYSATNVAVASRCMNHLGVKAVAKRVAKDTGVAVVTEQAKPDKTGPPLN